MSLIQIVDDFGAWDDLGVVTPLHEQWKEFPEFTESLSSVTRLIFTGEFSRD